MKGQVLERVVLVAVRPSGRRGHLISSARADPEYCAGPRPRPHHIENARHAKPTQHTTRSFPRRGPEQSGRSTNRWRCRPISEPRTRPTTGKKTAERRGIGIRATTRVIFGSTVGFMVAEPFAESLQPCGERRLVGRWLVAIIVSARWGHVWTHLAFETSCNQHDASKHHYSMRPTRRPTPARFQRDRGRSAAPEAARTILSGFGQVKNRGISR